MCLVNNHAVSSTLISLLFGGKSWHRGGGAKPPGPGSGSVTCQLCSPRQATPSSVPPFPSHSGVVLAAVIAPTMVEIKSRDIALPRKVSIVKAMVFPVVMYECESWTIKKAEHQRIDAFELWCWRRLLRVPWIARRSNQSIIKKISPEYSLERLMLKLPYFGHLMQRTDSLEKTLMLGKIEGRRKRGQQRMRWLDGVTNSMNMSLGKLREG